MDAAKIGTFIKNLRIKRGLTQQQIADQLHVINRAVSKWERGLSLPDIDLLEPLTVEEVKDSVLTVRGENTNPEYLRGTYKVVLSTDILVTDYSEKHNYRTSDIKNTSHLYIYYLGKRKIKNQSEIENVYKIVILENPL